MSGTRAEIERAAADAAAAKARLGETIAILKERLNPAVRAREAWTEARETVRDKGETLADDALEFAYERPAIVAGAVAAILALLLRKPLMRLGCRLWRWRQRPPKWDVPAAERT